MAASQASDPLWNAHGTELLYIDNSGPHIRLMGIPVETKGQFTLGQARELFSLEEIVATGIFKGMDVSPDGQRLVLVVDQFEELFRYRDYAGREEAEAGAAQRRLAVVRSVEPERQHGH